MAFNWGQFLALAEGWYGSPPSELEEAAYRAIISRAYYAAFKSASDVAIQHSDYRAVGTNEHENIRTYFYESPEMRRGRIGKNLNQLRIMRNDADYKNPYPNPNIHKEAQLAIYYAREVLDLLKEI